MHKALCAEYINDNHKDLDKKVYDVPEEIDKKVAFMKLKGMGINIDTLDEEQHEYLKGWEQ